MLESLNPSCIEAGLFSAMIRHDARWRVICCFSLRADSALIEERLPWTMQKEDMKYRGSQLREFSVQLPIEFSQLDENIF